MEEKTYKVLICDDSLLVRKKLRDLLEGMNCVVFEAKNGSEVIERFRINRPDIVFLDIVMPEVDGITALKSIKEFCPDAKVIMVSSTGTSSKLIEALKSGAADFIQKPYTPEQIKKIINALD